jgi:uncharacterized protein YciI
MDSSCHDSALTNSAHVGTMAAKWRGGRSVPAQQRKQFIYVIEPSRPELTTDPDAWTDEENQIATQHFAYLKQATEEGIVILAGRSPDGIGPAVVIFEASSEDQARRFMENDPFMASGLMHARLHPFRAALLRGAKA